MKIFVGVVTLMALVESSIACSCVHTSREEQFCWSSLVIAGVVNNVKEIFDKDSYSRYLDYPDEVKYNVTVSKVYRNTDETEDVTEGAILSFYTAGMDAMCGTRIATDTVYLITANKWDGKLRFGLCSWLPTRLTIEEILGIEGGYECK